jgi:nitroimidazol reductase NimA-like FMN-containing flavoprotein (pyridoxamine 5'-phosphate oxidase superfamily)
MRIGKLKLSDSLAILQNGNLGRLGCISDGQPYVIPVIYYFDGKDVYVHSLRGKKIDAMRANPRACLQVDEIQDSYNWRSVIAFGDYEEIHDEKIRDKVLSDLFSHTPHLTPVESKMTKGVEETVVFRIKVNQITGVGEKW